MALDHGVAAAGEEVGSTSDDELARGSKRDPVHGAHGLPVADVASGVPAAQHDPALLLCLAIRGDVARYQPSPSHGRT